MTHHEREKVKLKLLHMLSHFAGEKKWQIFAFWISVLKYFTLLNMTDVVTCNLCNKLGWLKLPHQTQQACSIKHSSPNNGARDLYFFNARHCANSFDIRKTFLHGLVCFRKLFHNFNFVLRFLILFGMKTNPRNVYNI